MRKVLNARNLLMFGWPVLLIGLLFLMKDQFFGVEASAGRKLYEQHCASCHMEEGQGLRALIPPVAGADYVAEQDVATLACLIRYGMKGPIVVNGQPYNQAMPGVASLTPAEINILINYLRRGWGENGPVVKYGEVEAALDSCEQAVGDRQK